MRKLVSLVENYSSWEMSLAYGLLLLKCLSENIVERNRFREILDCGKNFFKVTASDGCSGAVPCRCGLSECPFCKTCNRRLQVMKFMEDIFAFCSAMGKRIAFMRIVFTFPDDLQAVAWALPEKVLRSMAIRVMERLYSCGGRYQLGYQMSNHFWRTSSPFSGPFPHVDCNLLNVVRDIETGEYRTIDLYLPATDKEAGVGKPSLESARRYWREEIEAYVGKVTSKDVDVSFKGPRYGFSHLRQAVDYSVRSPQRDVLDFLKGHLIPANLDMGFVRELLVPRRQRKAYVYGGWLSNACRKRSCEELNVQLRSRKEFERDMKATFCYHGCLFERDYSSFPMSKGEVQKLNLRFIHSEYEVQPWEVALV